jgi:hypothetical protein
MFIVFIVVLILLYLLIALHEKMHPNDVPKIDNYWEVEEQLRRYKDDYFLNAPLFTTRIR